MEQANILEEERQLQEAIRLSKLPYEEDIAGSTTHHDGQASTVASKPSFPTHSGDRNERPKKRKAEEEIAKEVTKAAKHAVAMAYPNGGIRITRTPGRKNSANCINLADIVHREDLLSACIFSFFIANEELFEHLPLSHHSNTIPVSMV